MKLENTIYLPTCLTRNLEHQNYIYASGRGKQRHRYYANPCHSGLQRFEIAIELHTSEKEGWVCVESSIITVAKLLAKARALDLIHIKILGPGSHDKRFH